jgi:hypothetical protein
VLPRNFEPFDSYSGRRFLQAAHENHRANVEFRNLGFRLTAIATRHPTTADWVALRHQLHDLSENKLPEDAPAWNWRVYPLPAEWSPLSPDHTSYGFLLAAPFHQNEQKNFEENSGAVI